MKRTDYLIMVMGIATLVWGLNTDIVHAQFAEGTAKVQIFVNAAYDDSPQSLEEVGELLDALPPTSTTLEFGSSISDVILREFGFGKSDLDSTTTLLINEILRLNGLDSAEDAQAGELLIPTLPRRAFTRPNPDNYNNGIPKLLELNVEDEAEWATGEVAFDEVMMDDADHRGAQLAIMELDVPLDNLQQLLSTELGQSDNFNISSGTIFFDLDDETPVPTTDFPLFAELDAVEVVDYVKQSTRHSYLFIIDTGWPDESSYNQSLDAVENILDRRWKSLGEKPPDRNRKEFVPATCRHSRKIHQALSQVRGFDPDNDKVKTIYLPLSKEQNAADLLIELLELQLLHDKYRRSYDYLLASPDFRKKQRRKAKKRAEDIVDDLADQLGENCDQNLTYTDHSIISAIIETANFVSKKDSSAYFINLSWLPKRNQIPLRQINDPRGAIVVAAGNVPKDVISESVEFGSLVKIRGDIVAVMNIKNGELNCKSSWVSDPLSHNGLSIGYVGDLTQADCGGTSFAAPRVAWFLALGEAIRKDYVADSNWIRELNRDVRVTQQSVQGSWSNIEFDPIPYFKTK